MNTNNHYILTCLFWLGGGVCEVLLWAVLWRTVPLFLRSNLFNLHAVTQDSPTHHNTDEHEINDVITLTLFSNMMWQKRNVRRIDDGSQSKTDRRRWRMLSVNMEKNRLYLHDRIRFGFGAPGRGYGGFGRMYLSGVHCLSNRSAAILMRTTTDRRTDGRMNS